MTNQKNERKVINPYGKNGSPYSEDSKLHPKNKGQNKEQSKEQTKEQTQQDKESNKEETK